MRRGARATRARSRRVETRGERKSPDAVFPVDRAERSTRCPRRGGGLVGHPLHIYPAFPSFNFHILFSNFYVYNFNLQRFFLLNFFISKFCVRIFISNFSISESFASTFLAPKFFLVQKFCTTTFIFKIYGSQNILVQTLMYSNFCLQIFCFFNFLS